MEGFYGLMLLACASQAGKLLGPGVGLGLGFRASKSNHSSEFTQTTCMQEIIFRRDFEIYTAVFVGLRRGAGSWRFFVDGAVPSSKKQLISSLV